MIRFVGVVVLLNSLAAMDFSSSSSGLGGKSYAIHEGVTQHLVSGQVSPQQQQQLGHQLAAASSPGPVKAEDAPSGMSASSPAAGLAGFGVSAAGVNLSVNIGVNITGVAPEAATAPWATAAYTSR